MGRSTDQMRVRRLGYSRVRNVMQSDWHQFSIITSLQVMPEVGITCDFDVFPLSALCFPCEEDQPQMEARSIIDRPGGAR